MILICGTIFEQRAKCVANISKDGEVRETPVTSNYFGSFPRKFTPDFALCCAETHLLSARGAGKNRGVRYLAMHHHRVNSEQRQGRIGQEESRGFCSHFRWLPFDLDRTYPKTTRHKVIPDKPMSGMSNSKITNSRFGRDPVMVSARTEFNQTSICQVFQLPI